MHQNSDDGSSPKPVFLAENLRVLFTLRHSSPATEKKFKLVELFFSRANKIKTCLMQQLILGMHRDLILQSRDFQSLKGDPP